MPGTVRVCTPLASAARTTCRTTAPGARGMAMISSSTSCRRMKSGIRAIGPRIGRSPSRWPCLVRSSSTNPTGLSPSCGMSQQLLHDHLAGGARPHDQHPPRVLQPPPLYPPAEQPNQEPRERDQRRGEAGVDEEHRERDPERRQVQRRQHHRAEDRHRQGGNAGGEQDPLELRDAGMAPEAPIQAHRLQDRELDGNAEDDEQESGAKVQGTPVEPLEPDEVGPEGRCGQCDRVH